MPKHYRIALALGAALLIAGTLFVGSARGFTLFGPRSVDGWKAEELAVLASLRLSELPAAPNDPSNAYENSAAAVALGQRLFDDKRFSRNQAVSCASCHDPDRQFQDGRALGKGLGIGWTGTSMKPSAENPLVYGFSIRGK